MLIQALVPESSIEGFDVGVLVWFPWGYALMCKLHVLRKNGECRGVELRAVVAPDAVRKKVAP